MTKRQKKLIALATMAILATPPIKPPVAKAGIILSIIEGIATEPTQIANLGELLGIDVSTFIEIVQQVEQLAHEVQMIENQLQNLLKLGGSPEAIINTLEQLAGIVQQGQVLSYAAADIDGQYANLYPGYDVYRTQDINGATLQQKYSTWSRHNMDNIKAALKAAGVQQETITNERDLLRALKQESEDSEGRMQVLMAANRLAAQQGESLLSLRELVMTNNQLFANWMAKEQDLNDIERAHWEQSTVAAPTNTTDGTSIMGGIQ